MATVPEITLSMPTGSVSIPQVGFGVWQVPDVEVEAAVLAALADGYRHVDTAKLYENEAGVGRALAATDVPRDDVFVTTKVWPSEFGSEETIASFEGSVERLGLETLDLFLLHWPAPAQDRYVDAWKALIELRNSGRVRAIGVCNFEPEHLTRLHDETGEWPSINQIELHPHLQQKELRAFHSEHGIVTEAWSPLASGGDVLTDPVILGIADRLGATPAQVILRWHVQVGNVVLPKSVTPSRITANLDLFGFELTDDDLAAIAELDRDGRTGPDPSEFNPS